MQGPDSFELRVDGAVAEATVAHGWLDLSIIDARSDAIGPLVVAARARAAQLQAILVRTGDEHLGALLKQHGFRTVGAIANRPMGATETSLVLRIADAAAIDDGAVHPPKQELFDPDAMTNTDPKGVVRPVQVYREEPFGLYLFRSADHRSFHAVESWLLPRFNLRATIFRFNPGHERRQRVYLDVARVWRDGRIWRTTDWYLDLVEHPGEPLELIDVDELVAATTAGLLTEEEAVTATHAAARAIAGTAAHGHNVDAWFAAEGAPIAWRQAPSGR